MPATVTVDKQLQEAADQLGWNIVYQVQYNAAGETSWTPFAQAMQSNQAEGVVWTGEPENLAKLKQAMTEIDYKPKRIVTAANHYDQRFIDVAGTGANDVYMQSAFVPFFEADSNPPTQQYLDLFESTCRTARPRRCWPCSRGRPGCCSPPRPRSAAPT